MSDTEVGGTNQIFSASGDIVSCIGVSKGVLHRGLGGDVGAIETYSACAGQEYDPGVFIISWS